MPFFWVFIIVKKQCETALIPIPNFYCSHKNSFNPLCTMSETLLPVLYTTTQLRQAEMPKSAFFLERYTLKVSNFQKQIFLFSFEPKTEQNYFFDICPRDHSSITSAERWVGRVRKWQFLLIYSTIYADVGGWVGLKKPKTYWHNTWMVP